MIAAAQVLFDMLVPSFEWPVAATLAVCVLAAARLTVNGHARHWPVYLIAMVTALACLVKMTAPCAWTWQTYVGFELIVCVLALFIADAVDQSGRVLVSLYLFLIAGLVLAAAEGRCLQSYIALGVVDICAVLVLLGAKPRDRIEALAQFGVGWLLSFQALRAALLGVDESLALAVGQAGWAVHLLAFGLIAHAARK